MAKNYKRAYLELDDDGFPLTEVIFSQWKNLKSVGYEHVALSNELPGEGIVLATPKTLNDLLLRAKKFKYIDPFPISLRPLTEGFPELTTVQKIVEEGKKVDHCLSGSIQPVGNILNLKDNWNKIDAYRTGIDSRFYSSRIPEDIPQDKYVWFRRGPSLDYVVLHFYIMDNQVIYDPTQWEDTGDIDSDEFIETVEAAIAAFIDPPEIYKMDIGASFSSWSGLTGVSIIGIDDAIHMHEGFFPHGLEIDVLERAWKRIWDNIEL